LKESLKVERKLDNKLKESLKVERKLDNKLKESYQRSAKRTTSDVAAWHVYIYIYSDLTHHVYVFHLQ